MIFWRLGYILLCFDLSPLRIWRMLDDLLCVTCYPPNSDGVVCWISLPLWVQLRSMCRGWGYVLQLSELVDSGCGVYLSL